MRGDNLQNWTLGLTTHTSPSVPPTQTRAGLKEIELGAQGSRNVLEIPWQDSKCDKKLLFGVNVMLQTCSDPSQEGCAGKKRKGARM